MEYHLTHHMFPTVPSYNLDKLHHHIKDQLPEPNYGLIDAYKEIIPALIKQREDASYFIKKIYLNYKMSKNRLSMIILTCSI